MRNLLLGTMLVGLMIPALAEPMFPPASADKLPRWRGFNLLSKFGKEWSNGPFIEEDFRLIAELGFNFVRLPMDYRVWVAEDDWLAFDEAVLKEIDQAVAWGGQYGIHVCLNFHRAPGYTVASPKEKTDLWTDPETQAVFAQHWAMFARRYKGIPCDRLSFNLVNEPAAVDPATYARVARMAIDAIHKEDPDRLVISDGLEYGRKPCQELFDAGVAQATRGYEPMSVTHYKAGWVNGAGQWPLPAWPVAETTGFVYGPYKPELQAPLTLRGAVGGMELRLRVGTVSGTSRLVVRADGEDLWEKAFVCGPGEGEWREAVYVEEYDVYQNIYQRDYLVRLPGKAKEVCIENTEGDWLTLAEIGLRPRGGAEAVLALAQNWGQVQRPIRVIDQGGELCYATETMRDRAWLRTHVVAPWVEAKEQGIGVMVGEWGAFQHTPHDVTLRWMEDCLANWKEAGMGWALWNFRGGFGILDSGRADVDYEDWHGHKLDRKMLDLLLRY